MVPGGASLREFGFINPVIIDSDYNVIAGHGRIMAAKEEGLKEMPCVLVDYLTESQKKAYILSDNRMAMDAGWDEELLRIEIESLQGDGFEIGFTGFDENEPADLFGTDDTSDVKDDDYDLSAALEKAAFVQKGDIWMVGRHRLMCGDATVSVDVATLMDGKKANLVITDPPYNVAFESSDGLSIKNDKMTTDKFYEFLLAAFKNMSNHLESGGAAYIFHADTEGLNVRRAFLDAGFRLSGCCIWVKNALVLDTFGGSGSTLMTCEKINRICYMMELDEKYASVILRRYVEDTGDSENVFVIRNGEKSTYSDLVKEVEE